MVVLRAVENGIYTFDRHIPRSGHPYVIVHPYFDWYKRGNKGRWPRHRGYYGRIEDLIVGHKGPIITLEESAKLQCTARRYADLGRKRGSFFIETEEADPQPSILSWDAVARFLKRFQARPIRLAGSYLTRDLPQSIDGCVAGAYEGIVGAGLYAEIDFWRTLGFRG